MAVIHVMPCDLVKVTGLDGMARAFRAADVRLLQDWATEVDGRNVTVAQVTLCDGTQFDAAGDVEAVLGILGKAL